VWQKIAPQGARGWGSEFYFLPEFLFIIVRRPCKNLKPYDNPFWGFEQRYQEQQEIKKSRKDKNNYLK
jgi:hypothetical protein